MLCRYSAAIALLSPAEDPALLRLLLANRSAANLKAGRQQDALADAAAAVKSAPSWPKGHWRVGKALAALKR
jgi:translocation protein SEC72